MSNRLSSGVRVAGLLLAATFSGCSLDGYVRDADEDVDPLLAEYDERVLGDRENWVRYPDSVEEEPSVEEPYGIPTEVEVEGELSRDFDDPLDDESLKRQESAASQEPNPASEPVQEPDVGGDGQDPAAGEEGESDGKDEASAADPDAATTSPATTETTPDPGPSTTVDGTADAATGTPQEIPGLPTPGPDTLELDLATALRLAVEGNRGYLNQRESLYRAGLSFTLTRFNFGPQLDATIAYLWGDSRDGPRNHSLGGSFGVSQRLWTGGTIGLNVGADIGRTEGPHNGDPDKGKSSATNASINLSQPLLRGAGYDVAWESMIQAERNLVYAVRGFEEFRQGFSIDIADSFFNLVQQQKSLEIEQKRYSDALFDLRKAEALSQVDRNKPEDVFRARREEKSAKNTLLDRITDFQRNMDRFKIQLGLAVETEIVVLDENPPFEPVHVDPTSAVEVAMVNRLDVMTQYDQIEDSERQLKISEDSLLPDLNLNLNYALSEQGGRAPNDALIDANSPYSKSASLVLNIPIQQLPERNAYRSALISLDQQRRDLDQFLDTIENDVEDAVRQLKRTEEQIELQKDTIESETRSVRVTQIRYESGEVDNRELLDARQSLSDARQQLNSLYTSHFIGRLRLAQALGVLFIDENGMWK